MDFALVQMMKYLFEMVLMSCSQDYFYDSMGYYSSLNSISYSKIYYYEAPEYSFDAQKFQMTAVDQDNQVGHDQKTVHFYSYYVEWSIDHSGQAILALLRLNVVGNQNHKGHL